MAAANQTLSVRHPLLALSGRLLGHAAAIVLGFVLIVVGLALGVTMIMLPVGVVVAMLGRGDPHHGALRAHRREGLSEARPTVRAAVCG